MNLPPLSILIVEDNESFRENLGKLLQEEFPGTTVALAKDVEEGKQLLSSNRHFDIVILDFRLPVSTGGEQIDTSLCELTRHRHLNSLVIHVTAYVDEPQAAQHVKEVHPPCIETTARGSSMETQHLGIVISKGLSKDADVNHLTEAETMAEAERLGNEIVDAIAKRAQLMAIEAGLDAILGSADRNKRATGRVAVPDTSLTGRLAELSLALEDAWPWLPERTKARAGQLFTIRPREGAPDQVHVQML